MIPRNYIDMNRTYMVSGIIGGFSVWSIIGAILGSIAGTLWAPQYTVSFALAGAFFLGALGVVAAVVLTKKKHLQLDEYASGFARTDEEVRKALEDIEARKK